jgi:predicted NodU family carbamoyl transferase
MGMNFSNVSYALGCDDMGRAAGKVMGMASYGSQGVVGGVFNQFTIAQELELQAFEKYCTIIQRAIDLNPDTNKIILSGGFSLNCTNNYKYLERFPTHQFFVDPVPHDGGTAVGAASILYRNIMEGTDVSTEEGEENVAD